MKTGLLRRAVQASTFALIAAIPVLNRKGITVLMGSLYSLAIGPLRITDPLSGVQAMIASPAVDGVLLFSILIPVLPALIFGRVFCSWVCPQNTISEIFDYISERLGVKRFESLHLAVRSRYVIMACLLVSAPLAGFPVATLVSAPGIISVQTAKYIYEGAVGLELGLIGVIILFELFVVRRAWCNYICPVGGFLGIFRFGKTMKVAFAEDKQHSCSRCLACAKACRLGLDPMGKGLYPLCHNCGACIDACAKTRGGGGPLSFKF